MSHFASCHNNSSLTNGDTTQYSSAHANPGMVTDYNGFVAINKLRVVDVMCTCHQPRPSRNTHLFANDNATCRVKQTSMIDNRALADDYLPSAGVHSSHLNMSSQKNRGIWPNSPP